MVFRRRPMLDWCWNPLALRSFSMPPSFSGVFFLTKGFVSEKNLRENLLRFPGVVLLLFRELEANPKKNGGGGTWKVYCMLCLYIVANIYYIYTHVLCIPRQYRQWFKGNNLFKPSCWGQWSMLTRKYLELKAWRDMMTSSRSMPLCDVPVLIELVSNLVTIFIHVPYCGWFRNPARMLPNPVNV